MEALRKVLHNLMIVGKNLKEKYHCLYIELGPLLRKASSYESEQINK
jgi:hypothetical protein